MTVRILGLLAAGLLAGPITANAVPMVFSADSVSPAVVDFTIHFNDTGDGLLQFEEVTSFSGTSFNAAPMPILFEVAQTPFSTGNPTYWGFRDNTGQGYLILATRWVYSLATVPEPSTLALLSLGLAGLGLSRRRRYN